MQFLKQLLDFIFPPKCEVCRAIGPEALCGECRSKISYLKPTAFVHSVGIYEGPLELAIKRFKYKKKIHLAKPLAEIMSKYINSMIDLSTIDFLVPVPLHKNRLKERGFNQAELLSSEISVNLQIPTVSGMIVRSRETKPQFDLKPAERYKNVKGAFGIASEKIVRGNNLILIDDIYTTGSTITECTKILKDSGAQKVHVVTLSRAVNL